MPPKHSQRRVLKTLSDYDAMISWAENVSTDALRA